MNESAYGRTYSFLIVFSSSLFPFLRSGGESPKHPNRNRFGGDFFERARADAIAHYVAVRLTSHADAGVLNGVWKLFVF